MIELKDLVIVEVSREMQTTAEYFAEKRILYEYPRKGYGEYDKSHLENITNGYVGEFCFLEYMHKHLEEKFGRLNPIERYNSIKDYLVYKMIIGQVQPDWDFKIKGKSVEVKTYGTKILRKVEHVFNYKLLIDVDQVNGESIPDFYVQCFLIKDKGKLLCVLAGYHEGLPEKTCEELPKKAYCVPVKELNPMEGLRQLL